MKSWEKGKDAGSGRHTFIIAELSSNHCQSFNKAITLVNAAAWVGADAVKCQLFEPEQMCPRSDDPAFYLKDGPWAGQTLYDLYTKARTPPGWLPDLRDLAHSLNMAFVLSVYHPDAVPVAVEMKPDALKVASQEIGYVPLLDALVEVDLPIIFSTGTATLDELYDVMDLFAGDDIAFLKCCSQYPAPLESMDLLTIPDMAARFKVPIGLSDHTAGTICAVVATSVGASIIEKHLKMPGDDACLDASFSVDPVQFKAMVVLIRAAEQCLGQPNYVPATMRYKRRRFPDGNWWRTTMERDECPPNNA